MMRTKLGSIILLVLASAACRNSPETTNAASSPAPAQAPATAAAQDKVPVAHVTVIGCVEPSDSRANGPSGSADAKYMLTDARAGGSAANSANRTAGTTGTSGPQTSQQTSSTYRLEGKNGKDDEITPHVAHQVEIVAIEEVVPAGSAKPAAPKLKVEEIKMIGLKCDK